MKIVEMLLFGRWVFFFRCEFFRFPLFFNGKWKLNIFLPENKICKWFWYLRFYLFSCCVLFFALSLLYSLTKEKDHIIRRLRMGQGMRVSERDVTKTVGTNEKKMKIWGRIVWSKKKDSFIHFILFSLVSHEHKNFHILC